MTSLLYIKIKQSPLCEGDCFIFHYFIVLFLPFITAVVLSVPNGAYFVLGRIRVLLAWGEMPMLGMVMPEARSLLFCDGLMETF